VSKLLKDFRPIKSLDIDIAFRSQHISKHSHWTGLQSFCIGNYGIKDASPYSFLIELGMRFEMINFQLVPPSNIRALHKSDNVSANI
jgi:hypothetical protein